MEDYNIYGWAALHESCYKGYTNAVSKILEYSRQTNRNLIELRTIDDFKTTPILIAALGGHLEIVELLVESGADLNADLISTNNVRHGIIEIAIIRNDLPLLLYMYERIPDASRRIRKLMTSDKLDDDALSSVGRTVETFANDYEEITTKISKLKTKKLTENLINNLLNKQQKISYEIINNEDFGECLATFIKICADTEEGITSGIMILLKTLNDSKIRKKFCESNGIKYLIDYMER
jgi:ankyrin repeat protein